TGVTLTAVGIYSRNTRDPLAMEIRKRVMEMASSHEEVLQVHAFHVDTSEKIIRFDAVLSFSIDRGEAVETLCSEISAEYPDYTLSVTPDVDVSD
ncbi:MAG: hypothetical protein II518_00480, partial [Candidatus Methanomethylophilus sp.]|nr:hypothetical protein [Methanomethylophilus sp.]